MLAHGIHNNLNIRIQIGQHETGDTKAKALVEIDEGFAINSLTMSYFHTGTRTIIGAEAFHCPVRDGKEWDHLAMVIRLNF
jgi:hypothetical protein